MSVEKKNMYRENFPGYMGHIPYKYEVVGRTVGATNNPFYSKSLISIRHLFQLRTRITHIIRRIISMEIFQSNMN